MPILPIRGPLTGQCNICGNVGPLTEDHTPPKGYAPGVPVQITHIASRLGSDGRPRFSKSPDGVKYRSLCRRCNSELLGTQYDPALIKMAKDTTSLVTSELSLPATSMVRIKPQRVARSVLGHIAAQGVDRYLKGLITEPLRDYILDPSLPMLADATLYYWVYPHRTRVLARDIGILDLSAGGSPSMLWLMKSFPLGFAVVWGAGGNPGLSLGVRNFDAYKNFSIDDEVDVPIDLARVPHALWPEAPTDRTVLMLGEQAVTAGISPPRGTLLRT